MEKVECFKTTDGKVFEDAEEAFRHQTDIDFTEWYEKEYLMGNFAGSRVEVNEIKEWLKTNRDIILEFLGEVE